MCSLARRGCASSWRRCPEALRRRSVVEIGVQEARLGDRAICRSRLGVVGLLRRLALLRGAVVRWAVSRHAAVLLLGRCALAIKCLVLGAGTASGVIAYIGVASSPFSACP